MQVRKLISWLSEQLKQFWPAWLCFDSGFVVTHKAHVAINSTDHTLWEGNETGLPKGCQVLASAVQMGAVCYQSIFSNDQHCLHLRSCSAPSHPLNPLTWRSPFAKLGWRTEDALSESGLICTQFGSHGLLSISTRLLSNQQETEQQGQAFCWNQAVPDLLLPSAASGAAVARASLCIPPALQRGEGNCWLPCLPTLHIPELWPSPDVHCHSDAFLLKPLGKMFSYVLKKMESQTLANSAHWQDKTQ